MSFYLPVEDRLTWPVGLFYLEREIYPHPTGIPASSS